MRLLLVCLAGAAGSGLRYLLVTWTARVLGLAFPWGVLTVNVAGSFLIAAATVIAAARAGFSETARLAITAGFLGGLTTYSSFNQDTLKMIEDRAYATAALYVGATLLACLAAGALGAVLARRL